MQRLAVVGSLIAGERARSAMSANWRRPSSASCWRVRSGPRTKAARTVSVSSASTAVAGQTVASGVPAERREPLRAQAQALLQESRQALAVAADVERVEMAAAWCCGDPVRHPAASPVEAEATPPDVPSPAGSAA